MIATSPFFNFSACFKIFILKTLYKVLMGNHFTQVLGFISCHLSRDLFHQLSTFGLSYTTFSLSPYSLSSS